MLSKENILNALGYQAEQAIYKHYLNIDAVPSKYYKNPFVGSQEKTFKFYVNSVGRLAFKDFSPTRESYKGDVFTAVMFSTGKDFVSAMKDIDATFKLGLNEKRDYVPVKRNVAPYQPYEPKEYAEIRTITQNLTPYDKKYFEQYNIYWQILHLYGVKSAKMAFLNDKPWLTSCNHLPLFTYQFDDGSQKVYSPKHFRKKWLGNANKNVIANIKQLPKTGDKLVITSAVKDGLVFSTHGYFQVSFMSETVIPDNLENLLIRFNEVYCWYDNDLAGVTATKKLCDKHKNIIPIYWKADEKDISDYSLVHGFSKTKRLINQHIGKPSFSWTQKHKELIG